MKKFAFIAIVLTVAAITLSACDEFKHGNDWRKSSSSYETK